MASVAAAPVRWSVLIAAVVLALSTSVRAESAADAAESHALQTLPELPEVPSSRFEKPSPEALEGLEQWLTRVTSKDPLARERAVRETVEISPQWVDAIYHKLNQIADDSNKDAMKERLRKIRDETRNAIRLEMRADGKRGSIETPDYLKMVAEAPVAADAAYKNLIQVLAMSRALVAIGNVQATRALIQIFVRFGEFLRVDTQLQLDELGDKALAGLIEATAHPAEKIQRWAKRQLDSMGKAIPGEAVQIETVAALPDILRAYGRISDPDAARIIVSFANSERAQLRLASRQAIALFGEVANWQLRDTYLNIVGKTPPRDWDWKRTARELFGAFDRLRLARVQQLFEQGLKHRSAGELEKMAKSFDEALAENPMFEHRAQMVNGYLSYAKKLPKDKLSAGIAALYRAERITEDLEQVKVIKSLRLTLQAEQRAQGGLIDRTLIERARELDPRNQRALALFETASDSPDPQQRYQGALAILVIAIVGVLVVFLSPLLRRRGQSVLPPDDASELPTQADNPTQRLASSDETSDPGTKAES